MTRDALEKLIESVVDWSRAYQHALDQWPEKEAVACESELKIAKAKLLAALAPEPNQPVGRGLYDLTLTVGIDGNGRAYVYEGPHAGATIGNASSITGHWRKVEP